jgi:hypothetical protein
MKDCGMHRFGKFIAGLALVALLCASAAAETLHLTDGTKVTGDVVTMDDRGIILKISEGNYSDPIPWSKLSQDDLRTFQQNPKAANFVEPWIELTQEDKVKRTQVEVKDVPHLSRPAKGSLIGAMASSGIGVFLLLILYAANIYAAYEISNVRSRPPGVVCGVAAVAPILGPILFFCLPPGVALPEHKKVEEWRPPSEEYAEAPAAEAAPVEGGDAAPVEGEPGKLHVEGISHGPAAAAAPAMPPTKTFARGQYTFNRRFFETQMPSFFGVVRHGADKDLVLSVRAARGTYIAQRIQRISANEMNLQVQKGHASEEVVVPFVEIQEVQVKHRDA